MSFLSELEEGLDSIWPLLEEHEFLDSMEIRFDFACGYIYVNMEDEHGTHMEATIEWPEETATLMTRLHESIQSAISVQQSAVDVVMEHARDQSALHKERAKLYKGLIPSPLEELAAQAE